MDSAQVILLHNISRFANGINESVNSIAIAVYPNPTSGSLNVKTNTKNCIFEVYDIIGKKVFSQRLNESETKVELNSFNNGTYLYKIVQDGLTLKADKLILNK